MGSQGNLFNRRFPRKNVVIKIPCFVSEEPQLLTSKNSIKPVLIKKKLFKFLDIMFTHGDM